MLKGYGELSCENLFADGTKIEANANKHTFVWKKTILKNGSKLQARLHAEFLTLLEKYAFKMYIAEDIKAKKLKKFLDRLKKIKYKSKYSARQNFSGIMNCFQIGTKEKKYEYYLTEGNIYTF